ncbi:putative monovalent cation/H+ antiporter subunit A [Pararhodonellum marinum]|uniref:putative monovalent cation/H+ antiporter subunit A n=1 Tax=Pararhodonellum marinum TaxID=2755358 RepID=UPI00188FB7A5|nr:putative monovalent cation/H+ antiporter subunit A [Pararhodonellum marinum]
MLIAVLSGFILALSLVITGKWIKGKGAPLVGLFPLALFGYFVSFFPAIMKGESLTFTYEWIPSLGVNLSFHLDGLSLLFCLLITGIGALVFFYTAPYLKEHIYLDRFFGYLSMFMGSMLGLVLSDNIITLFVFWELTSISSFFLIGFNNESEESRRSAMMALSMTGIGGLFLLASMIVLGTVGGSYEISTLLGSADMIKEHENYLWIIGLLFIGAFTKSAQFPFHFWLPDAMKAPTPVSTYLHSATMVKAGIYLLARFTPMLGETVYWNGTLIIIGSITMVYAAIHAVFRLDLKGILAYSTISALGILVFLIGLGTDQALLAAAVFILVHALYKATLFLITGIIDHETGTRDVSKLSGLNKVMLPVGIAGILAAISNAGIPPSFGFVGKDLIYEATLGFETLIWVLSGVALLTNICLMYAGFQAGIKPFTGQLPKAYEKVHLPSPLMWVPPLLLGSLGMVFGLMPFLIDKSLIQAVVNAMIRGGALDVELKLWHGFNLVLLLSGITLAAGFLLYYFLKPSALLEAKTNRWEKLSPKSLTKGLGGIFSGISKLWTGFFQNGYLRYYLIFALTFLTFILAYKLFKETELYINFNDLTGITFYEVAAMVIIAFAVLFTVLTKSRLAAVASLGVVGYSICLVFLFYSAPDLAMTQFSIDTLTVILFVLVIYNLPKYLKLSNQISRVRDGIMSVIFGALISILTLEVLNEPVLKETSQFYAENAYTLAKGKNVVNVILVDFRGTDTFVEITVLAIAALGVYSLLKLQLKSTEKE